MELYFAKIVKGTPTPSYSWQLASVIVTFLLQRGYAPIQRFIRLCPTRAPCITLATIGRLHSAYASSVCTDEIVSIWFADLGDDEQRARARPGDRRRWAGDATSGRI